MSENVKVLIVDDQDDNRFAIKLALKKEGYEFLEACDGKEAVEFSLKHLPDVILMDAVMPNMDGFEATKMIRSLSALERTPILMITSLNQKEDYIKAIEVGANDFVSKPFDKSEIIARCRAYVNMSDLNKKYVNATRNPITQLPNANALRSRLEEEDKPIIILAKIDGYKSLSELYSTTLMRKYEVEFVKIMRKNFPMDSTEYMLYNTAPGYFAFLTSELLVTSTDVLRTLCEKFYTLMREDTVAFSSYEVDISVTIGVSIGNEVSLEHANLALNEAKKFKKPFIMTAEVLELSKNKIINNILWIKKIKEGIAENMFVPYFQPIFHNQKRKIDKFECLVRYKTFDGEIIAPGAFIDIAKKARYYHQITKLMIDQCMEVFKDKTYDFSINLSARDIDDEYMRTYIIEKIKQYPDVSKRMIFEFLEDEESNAFTTLQSFILDVKSFGVKIAIDDFGSGYSNFVRLMDYQPDIIKIDGTLIENIAQNSFSQNIVGVMQEFCTKMNFQTVGEFVSSSEALEKVAQLGLTYSQGYEISKPIPKEEIEKVVLKYNN